DVPACVLAPAMTEGPFFVDAGLERADLTAGASTPGVRSALPLALAIRLVDVRNGCRPVPGFQVDLWHTDALGRYSGVQGVQGQTFCRGFLRTDADGSVAFRTVYPGWYPGRTIHIHVKARRHDRSRQATYAFTTQIFFDEALNDAVMALPVYDSRGPRTTLNARDGIYGDATRLITRAALRRDGTPTANAAITLGLDLPA
ncbi:MAG: twin-arginine translocation pathway signal protein, partial [Casimicrobiaceae bacterium]